MIEKIKVNERGYACADGSCLSCECLEGDARWDMGMVWVMLFAAFLVYMAGLTGIYLWGQHNGVKEGVKTGYASGYTNGVQSRINYERGK